MTQRPDYIRWLPCATVAISDDDLGERRATTYTAGWVDVRAYPELAPDTVPADEAPEGS